MSYSVIVSQGRVADRTAGALVGARLVGEALGEYLGKRPVIVGRPTAPAEDDWSESLPAAEQTLNELREELRAALDVGDVPVLATNTCAASLATLPDVAARFPEAVVLWIDAHGDFNTPETTDSGYLGGMVLAAACGLWESGHGAGLDPRQVVLVGARDIDSAERELLDRAGVRILTPAESSPRNVLEIIAGRPVWIHVDWDVLEPGYIPAAYRVPDGLLPHEVAELFASIPRYLVRGVEFAEFEAGDPSVPERLSVELVLETFQHLVAQHPTLDGRRFSALSRTEGGEIGPDTVFEYHESEGEIWASYAGGAVRRGFLVGTRTGDMLSFRYSQLNQDLETSNGHCVSEITRVENGRLRLNETWEWESKPGSGLSVVEEIAEP